MNEPDPQQVADEACKAFNAWSEEQEQGEAKATPEQRYAMLQFLYPNWDKMDEYAGDDFNHDLASYWAVREKIEKEFQAAALKAVRQGDHAFFTRMARAAKEKRNPEVERNNRVYGTVFFALCELLQYVREHSELPTAENLIELMEEKQEKLSPDRWKNVRNILKLAGKLPRKPKSSGI